MFGIGTVRKQWIVGIIKYLAANVQDWWQATWTEQGLYILFSSSSTRIKRKKTALESTALSQPSDVYKGACSSRYCNRACEVPLLKSRVSERETTLQMLRNVHGSSSKKKRTLLRVIIATTNLIAMHFIFAVREVKSHCKIRSALFRLVVLITILGLLP